MYVYLNHHSDHRPLMFADESMSTNSIYLYHILMFIFVYKLNCYTFKSCIHIHPYLSCQNILMIYCIHGYNYTFNLHCTILRYVHIRRCLFHVPYPSQTLTLPFISEVNLCCLLNYHYMIKYLTFIRQYGD